MNRNVERSCVGIKKTVTIVGGGFSGVMSAVHMLRNPASAGKRIILVNRSGRVARGVAYGTRTPEHVLNVPAARMSAFADDDTHFLRFAQERDASITGGDFVARSLYGEYLESVLRSAEAGRSADTEFVTIAEEVKGIRIRADGSQVALQMESHEIRSDHVLLAIGNFPPADVPAVGEAVGHSWRYVQDPWLSGALNRVALDQPVLLIGTGLTMVDMVRELRNRGLSAPMIAISRRGLLPLSHRSPATPPPPPAFAEDFVARHPTVRSYLHALRAQVSDDATRGTDWRESIGALRHITPQLWARLSIDERSRFLRHLAPYWEVHRHRMAPELASILAKNIAEGALRVRAGRIRSLREDAAGIAVSFRPRAAAAEETFDVGTIINCTGPCSDLRKLRDHLMVDMMRQGLIRMDANGVGIETDDQYRVLQSDGSPSHCISYVGPFLRSKYWESTAVPELRVHAAKVAWAVLG